MRVGVLGGTFDPVHQGHILLARAARDQFRLGKVLFVPAFIPPHKSSRRDLTPAPYRYRMVEMAIRGENGFEISDIEFARPDVSYTVDTLRALKQKSPHDELFLILGEDAFLEMPQWQEPDEIRKLAKFLVVRRPGTKDQALFEEGVERIRMKPCPFSSSGIRDAIRSEKFPDAGELSPAVGDYIQRMNLYRSS